jgi:hypothetical protein
LAASGLKRYLSHECSGSIPNAWLKVSFRRVDGLRADFEQEASRTISSVERTKEEASKRIHLEEIVSKNEPFARIPFIIYFYLLPVALELRLTKVTAEVRLARAKARQEGQSRGTKIPT